MSGEIFVTGYRTDNWWDYYNYATATTYDSSSYSHYYGYYYSATYYATETLDQRAANFAANAVKYGPGFDPNNPEHKKIADQTKESLKQAFIDANDGVESTALNTNGQIITDAQLRTILSETIVTLQTGALNGNNDPASFHRASDDAGNPHNYIRIDIDHPNLTSVANAFGSLVEAVNLALFHEIGHAVDLHDGSFQGTEPVANYIALQLGGYVGVPMPTAAEMKSVGYDVYTPPAPVISAVYDYPDYSTYNSGDYFV